MCGIFARINPLHSAPRISLNECRQAAQLLQHRGPDAQGEWVDETQSVYLGFRRLSILDLSEAANQPMEGDGGNQLIFNGEIYNYREIRTQLESSGIRFRTRGDTEVLLRALETWGEEALPRLEGMFSFLFWDARRLQALIVRDFLGIKPLYFWKPTPGGLCIASELKSFYALTGFEPAVNLDALPEYCRFRALTGETTLLKNVFQVPPGHLLVYSANNGHLQSRQYWKPEQEIGTLDGDPLELLRHEFRGSVDRHLLSDVPVGAQLSGGVDSSLSLAVATRDLGRNMKAFHCSVEDESANESAYADAVARHLGVEMHTVQLMGDNFFSALLEKLTWHMDEPLGHPNAVGVHLVSALSRPQVTVLISGEGADEVFAGYGRYSALLRHERLRQVPALAGLLSSLPAADLKYYRTVRKNAVTAGQSTGEEIVTAMQFVSPSLLAGLLGPESVARSEASRRQLLESISTRDPLTRSQVFDLSTYLPALLIRQDKMSMAASIENRVPFVTPRMVHIGLSLPPALRATLRQQKVIVKQLFCDYVPRPIVYRKKFGFGIPLSRWFNSPCGRERMAWLRDPSCALYQLLDPKPVLRLLDNFQGSEAEVEVVWVMLTLALWWDIFRSRSRVLA